MIEAPLEKTVAILSASVRMISTVRAGIVSFTSATMLVTSVSLRSTLQVLLSQLTYTCTIRRRVIIYTTYHPCCSDHFDRELEDISIGIGTVSHLSYSYFTYCILKVPIPEKTQKANF